jgi:hypothetical protein
VLVIPAASGESRQKRLASHGAPLSVDDVMTAAVAASIDRAFHQLLLYSVLPCAHRFDVTSWEHGHAAVTRSDVVGVLAYFRDALVQLFKFYGVTPEGERDLPLPEPELSPEVLNTLSAKDVKAWRAFHANSDPTDHVRMRFDAYKRFVQDFKLTTELGMKYKAVAEAFLASAQYAGFDMPLKFRIIPSHQVPIPKGDVIDVSGLSGEMIEPRKRVAVSLQDRVVLTTDQVRWFVCCLICPVSHLLRTCMSLYNSF